jgi:hypothetical protein
MTGKLHLTLPSDMSGARVPVSIVNHDLAVIRQSVLPESLGGIELEPGVYAARAVLPNGRSFEAVFEMSEAEESRVQLVELSPAGNATKAARENSTEALPEANVDVVDQLESIAGDTASYSVVLSLVSIDLDGKTSAETALQPDPSGAIEVGPLNVNHFVRARSDRDFYVAAPTSDSERFTISFPSARMTDFNVRLQDDDADLFLRYLDSRRIEQLSELVSDYWPRAKEMLYDKHERPIAAAVGAYVIMLVGSPDPSEGDSTRSGNWLDRWTENLFHSCPWLVDALCIRVELLARRGNHREALDLLQKIPARGLPMFTSGFRFALDRLSSYRNAAASGKLEKDDGDRIDPILNAMHRIAANVNFERPVLSFWYGETPAG